MQVYTTVMRDLIFKDVKKSFQAILAAQTGHCLEKLLLTIINFGSLAIFHEVFALCYSMRSSISSVQHHVSSKILTAAC